MSDLYSLDAEQSVIGSLFLDPQALDRIDWLLPDHFYHGHHRTIYEAQRQLIEASQAADPVMVAQVLADRGALVSVGGVGYLGSIAAGTPSAYNIARYAEVVRDKAILRRLAGLGAEITEKAQHPLADASTIADETEHALLALQGPSESGDPLTMSQAVDEALEWAERPQQGLSTGFPQLDRIVGGLRPEELIIIAGRPGMGKSSLAGCIAEHAAADRSVLFCSLEMSARMIAGRSLAYHRAKLGTDGAVAHLAGLGLHIDPRSPLSIAGLRLRARRHRRKHGLDLIVVDYLQLMSGPKADNRHQEIGAISRGLKGIAKEFSVPVIAVASLNRQAEARTDRRPIMSDLKESGDIESDADIVMMIYRDEEYHENSEWRGIAEIIVRKHREGATGTVFLGWHAEHTRFTAWHPALPVSDPPNEPEKRRRPRLVAADDNKTRAGGE